jgi:hypothetical protein
MHFEAYEERFEGQGQDPAHVHDGGYVRHADVRQFEQHVVHGQHFVQDVLHEQQHMHLVAHEN